MQLYRDFYIPMQSVMSFSKDKHEKFNRYSKCFGETKHRKINDNELMFREVLSRELHKRK